MKKFALLAGILFLQHAAFAQGVVQFPNTLTLEGGLVIAPGGTLIGPPRGGSGGASYSTGTLLPPPAGVSGSAADVRTRSFEGSGYFTSTGDSADTTFALRLGNGVNPAGLNSSQIQVVPEPSTLALGGVALALFLFRRARS